jgi:type IV pilus assembly protein PilX
MKNISLHLAAPRAQRGAILIAVLAILLVLTLLGIAGMRATTLEERMAGNFQENYLAFQAAEAALRVAEEQLADAALFGALPFNGSSGTYDVQDTTGSVDPFAAFDSSADVVTITDSAYDALAADPQYFIEQLPMFTLAYSSEVVGFQSSAPQTRLYRITARGVGRTTDDGGNPISQVILQSTFHR